ncbi:MAG TPA: N-acetyltransferase family protein [Paracoccaceae bacterium]|nr:N-acetyltransferase family protein [Paracoccaceae bacterium]
MIRPAGPGDAEGILAIWNPLIRDTAVTFNAVEKTAQEVAGMVATRQAALGNGFLVAEGAGGAIAGFATWSQFRGGVGYARTAEHTILLGPAARGRGLGRKLMAAAEEAAREEGIHSMFGGVSAENPAGVAFHAAMGYAEVARLREVGWKFGRWMDLVLMQKFL